jgi:cellulose 1,4-beta-cellobiosidase
VPGNSVTLTWNAPAVNGGAPVSGYRIYRSTVSGAETFLVAVGAVSSYTDETTTYGTTYYYKLSAVNTTGEGALSNELFATPVQTDGTAPSTPASVKALILGTSQAALNWTASTDNVGVTGYRVYRDGSLVGTTPDPHYLDDGMAAGSSHSYQVRAIDAAGNASAASSTLSARLASLSGTTGTLSGVVYSSTGKLLTNVVVSYRLANGTVKSAKTNMSGIWKLSSLPLGPYTLTAELTGYQSQTFNMTAASGQTLLAITTLG